MLTVVSAFPTAPRLALSTLLRHRRSYSLRLCLPFCQHHAPSPHSSCAMASTEANRGAKKEAAAAEVEKGEKTPTPTADPSSPPPLMPPEKPLPGDCCGSGCVRCVWDIYYEELEAYNESLAASTSK
ncbi:oxidoreductase-like domain-containing protein 1 [Zingiber officinale]|nr:oxidoreductase-like domain-containing protein 1 [Zingiber officinale]